MRFLRIHAIWNGELRSYSSPRTEESFRGISGVVSYIDDIVLYNDSWEEHLRTLKELLERRVRITAHPTKCLLGADRMEFLGHRIRCEVITPRKGTQNSTADQQEASESYRITVFKSYHTQCYNSWNATIAVQINI